MRAETRKPGEPGFQILISDSYFVGKRGFAETTMNQSGVNNDTAKWNLSHE